MPWTKPYRPPSNQRLNTELYEQPGYITFITIHARKSQAPFVESAINQMVIDTLQKEQERLHCSVFVYCLMPDHLHYLISPRQPGCSVLKFTEQFKGKTTNQSWSSGWHGKLWQPRYYDHIVRKEEDLEAFADYILANPYRKGLVSSPDEWPWSGCLSPFP